MKSLSKYSRAGRAFFYGLYTGASNGFTIKRDQHRSFLVAIAWWVFGLVLGCLIGIAFATLELKETLWYIGPERQEPAGKNSDIAANPVIKWARQAVKSIGESKGFRVAGAPFYGAYVGLYLGFIAVRDSCYEAGQGTTTALPAGTVGAIVGFLVGLFFLGYHFARWELQGDILEKF